MEQWIRRALCVLQVGGGFLGVVVTVSKFNPNVLFEAIICLVFVALYAFGILAGVALIEGRRWGRRASIAYWWLQVPVVSSPLIAYSLWSGAVFSVYMRLDALTLGFSLNGGAGFAFSVLRDAPYLIGVNLFAVFALYLLHDVMAGVPWETRTSSEPEEPRPSLAERVATERQSAPEQT